MKILDYMMVVAFVLGFIALILEITLLMRLVKKEYKRKRIH